MTQVLTICKTNLKLKYKVTPFKPKNNHLKQKQIKIKQLIKIYPIIYHKII